MLATLGATEAARVRALVFGGCSVESIFSGYSTVLATEALRALRFGCALALGAATTGAAAASSSAGIFGALGPVAGKGSGFASPDLQGVAVRAAALALGLLTRGVSIL